MTAYPDAPDNLDWIDEVYQKVMDRPGDSMHWLSMSQDCVSVVHTLNANEVDLIDAVAIGEDEAYRRATRDLDILKEPWEQFGKGGAYYALLNDPLSILISRDGSYLTWTTGTAKEICT